MVILRVIDFLMVDLCATAVVLMFFLLIIFFIRGFVLRFSCNVLVAVAFVGVGGFGPAAAGHGIGAAGLALAIAGRGHLSSVLRCAHSTRS